MDWKVKSAVLGILVLALGCAHSASSTLVEQPTVAAPLFDEDVLLFASPEMSHLTGDNKVDLLARGFVARG